MGGREALSYWEDVGLMMLIGGVLLPPFAWLMDLEISYAIVKWTCEHDRRFLVMLIPLGSLSITAAAAWMSWSSWVKLRAVASAEGGHIEDRSYFLAIAGLFMSAVFAILIIASMAPRFLLSPCE